MDIRIGNGFDVHAFEEGNFVILGGVKIPHTSKLSGHSDADVLTHAICDAVLGAVALGDIGTYFPDSDPKYKGVSSLVLLKETLRMLEEKNFEIVNIDSTIVCEKPKISPHVSAIRDSLSEVTELNPEYIGVKATTTDGMGFTGREEGIAAYAVVIIHSNNP